MNDNIVKMKEFAFRFTSAKNRMSEIDKEMDRIPVPKNPHAWVESIPDLNKKSFTLSDYDKVTKLRREYMSLKEEVEITSQLMRELQVVTLLDRVNNILNEGHSDGS